jgi:hypothetical protein
MGILGENGSFDIVARLTAILAYVTSLYNLLNIAPLNAVVSISSNGDNTVITPTVGKALRIRRIVLVAASSVSMVFKLGTTAKSGAIPFLTFADSDPTYIFSGAVDEVFKINLSSGVAVTGYVSYYEV